VQFPFGRPATKRKNPNPEICIPNLFWALLHANIVAIFSSLACAFYRFVLYFIIYAVRSPWLSNIFFEGQNDECLRRLACADKCETSLISMAWKN